MSRSRSFRSVAHLEIARVSTEVIWTSDEPTPFMLSRTQTDLNEHIEVTETAKSEEWSKRREDKP